MKKGKSALKAVKPALKKMTPEFLWIQYLKFKTMKRLRGKELLWFGVHLADHCNLNCKCCDNFSPIADEKYLDIKQFSKDCSRISILSKGKIEGISLRGGEPLLHPEIEKIIEITRNNFPDAQIKIVTNGILLLKMPETFWNCCKQYNISIKQTKYPINLDFDAIERLIKGKGVGFEYYGETGMILKTMTCYPLDTEGNQKMWDSFIRCGRNDCTNLTDGKIYLCDIIPNVKYFNRHFGKKIEVIEKDSINIYVLPKMNLPKND
jgi:MoaA/NifB/PqqE/SkfB family radical SAM enzyme